MGGRILNPEVVFARALALMLINTDFDFKKVLSHKLASFPFSLFDNNNVLRTAKQKSKPVTLCLQYKNDRDNLANISNGVIIKIPYGVDVLLHQPALHPIFSYCVG